MKKLVPLFLAVMCLTSCTLSFSNIDTHGTATDLVDETLSTDPEVDPTITVPLNPAL